MTLNNSTKKQKWEKSKKLLKYVELHHKNIRKIKNERLNKKFLSLFLKEIKHAVVLIWSGKLFQSEGAMTEKKRFP